MLSANNDLCNDVKVNMCAFHINVSEARHHLHAKVFTRQIKKNLPRPLNANVNVETLYLTTLTDVDITVQCTHKKNLTHMSINLQ